MYLPPSPHSSSCIQGLGAYTGSHTADQVKEAGLGWVLVGHSERRSIFGETDAMAAAKTRSALDAGLQVILCIGESLAEREAGITLEVVFRQLAAAASGLTPAEWARVVVAYEPVWAIGTGRTASAAQAQEVHASLRTWLREHAGAEVAPTVRIIYGGSVSVSAQRGMRRKAPRLSKHSLRVLVTHTPRLSAPTSTLQGSNCKGLIAEKDIDGFLVGGASLKPEFVDIVQSCMGGK